MLTMLTHSSVDNAGKGHTTADIAFVLKRIRIGAGKEVHLSGLREAYFGQLLCNDSAMVHAAMHVPLRGCQHVVRFVESFQVICMTVIMAWPILLLTLLLKPASRLQRSTHLHSSW